jgi:hypothetical protein
MAARGRRFRTLASTDARRKAFSLRFLRRILYQLGACLAVISPLEAKVLDLRTGGDARRSFSAKDVAGILHVSLGREAQLEAGAVSTLGRVAKRRSCATASSAALDNTAAIVRLLPARALPTEPVAGPGASSRSARRRSHRRAGGRRRGAVGAAISGPVLGLLHGGPAPTPFMLIVLAVLGAAALLLAVRRTRPLAADKRDADNALLAYRELDEYRRADDRGDDHGALDLGVQLADRGDVDGALAAFQRADARGSGAAACNLGVLLEQMGDIHGALAAYRRSGARGCRDGAFNLGALLAERGDFEGAIAAFHYADAGGDPLAALSLGVLLAQQGDLDGARATYRRALERGDPQMEEAARSALRSLDELGDESAGA